MIKVLSLSLYRCFGLLIAYKEFLTLAKEHMPSLLQKPKMHLLLHLSSNMTDFGPASYFNTERFATSDNYM